ncbi:MAG: iron ABC transporter permease [Deltaproteobacteria bacterium]|nr:iron ABC transporter permease [Deltaproteobacteria bacterium]
MKEKKKKLLISLVGSFLILLICVFSSIIVGPAGMVLLPKDIYEEAILFDLRLPRVLLGFAAGGSLSLSGLLLQGIFRNALVEPYTLGISGGAAIFVAISIITRLDEIFGSFFLSVAGFVGSFVVLLIILFLSSRKHLKKEELLLSGVMISFVCSSFIMLLFAIVRSEDVHRIIFWMMGTLQEDKRGMILFLSLVSVFFLLMSYLFSVDLNALQLGEEEASHLGVDVFRIKRILLILSSVLTGITVSITGIIGFVGLLVPHVMRLFFGSDHRFLVFSSFFFGSSFLIVCDTISRILIRPAELPVGVITGIFGGSLFLYLLLRRKE